MRYATHVCLYRIVEAIALFDTDCLGGLINNFFLDSNLKFTLKIIYHPLSVISDVS